MKHSDDEQIIYLYDELRYSMREVAKLVYWSPNYVRNRLIANGIELRSRGGNKLPPPNPDLIKIAAFLYEKRGLNAKQVGERMGIAEVTVLRYLERGGVKRRNNRDATRCMAGHTLTRENTYIHGNKRRCRICKNRRNREWMLRSRAESRQRSG